MTLPDERYRAVREAENFLRDLMDTKENSSGARECQASGLFSLATLPQQLGSGSCERT